MLAGCGQARSENGGPTVERSYSVGDFDRIELAGAYDVTVHTGAKPGVQARGGENVLERLVVEVRNGILVIEPRKSQGLNWNWSNNGKVTIDVDTFPDGLAARHHSLRRPVGGDHDHHHPQAGEDEPDDVEDQPHRLYVGSHTPVIVATGTRLVFVALDPPIALGQHGAKRRRARAKSR